MRLFDDYIVAGGTLPEGDFSRLSSRAVSYVRQITLGKSDVACGHARDAVNLAIFEVVEELHRQEHGGELTSAAADGYSEAYAATGMTPNQRLYALAARHLACTGLLDRRLGLC